MKETPLTKQADRVLQQTVLMLYEGKCAWCRKMAYGAGHHLYGRERQDTRWVPALVPYLCQECHNKVHNIGQFSLLAHLKEHLQEVWKLYDSKAKEKHIPAWDLEEFIFAKIKEMYKIQEFIREGK